MTRVMGACVAKLTRWTDRSSQARRSSAPTGSFVPQIVHDVLRTPGHPLDASARSALEPQFGFDFSAIRVHTDASAALSAHAVAARAYTAGRHIVMADGEYQPASATGRRLLMHELTHVVQQRESLDPQGQSLPLGTEDAPAELEADRLASSANSRLTPTIHEHSPGRVQRQVYGPAAATGAGTDFDNYLLQFSALEQAAIADGYGFDDRITAFRKLYYDSASSATTYAGAVVGGGVWNILIPGAAATKLPPSWSTGALKGSVDYIRAHQVLPIGGKAVDVGHMLAGADAAKHPTKISLGAGTINLRSNVEASTFIGDLGSVVTEYIHGSPTSFRDTAMVRTSLLDSYYDGSHAMASAADMAGNADAYALKFDAAKTVADNLKDYYAATVGGAKKRFTSFAAGVGLGALGTSGFPGDSRSWRQAMTEQVFNAALAYAAGKGWRSDVINVLNDPGPGIIAPTFWEMYWNISEWVVDIFVDRMKRDVAKE